jgi:erythromycin esterase
MMLSIARARWPRPDVENVPPERGSTNMVATTLAMRILGACAFVLVSVACSRSAPPTTETVGHTLAEHTTDGTLELEEVVDLGAIDSSESLERLRPLLEDARVVLLGEASHGDGATKHAIARLVRYLHEELGFEVLALESGLYDCDKAWELAKQGGSAEQVATTCAFGTWRETRPVWELWAYLVAQADAASPLVLAGFDNQFSGARGGGFVDDAVAVLDEHGARAALPEGWLADFEAAVKSLRQQPLPERTVAQRERERDAIAAALGALKSATGGEHTEMWIRLFEGLVAEERSRWLYQQAGQTITDEDMNLRDEQMARNLIWLLTERYPDKRFVVWAATMHTVRNSSLLGVIDHGDHLHDYTELRPMGDWLVSELPSLDVVSLAFVGLEGTRGWPSGYTVELPEPAVGSFEAAALDTGLAYGLVDLSSFRDSDHWLAGSFSSAIVGEAMEAPWGRVVDAIAFIRTMTPTQAAAPRAGSARDPAAMPHLILKSEEAALDEVLSRIDRATSGYAQGDRVDSRFVLPPMAEHAKDHYVEIEVEGSRIKVHTYPVSDPLWEIYFTVDEHDEMVDAALFEG